jgi:hypothetical protein
MYVSGEEEPLASQIRGKRSASFQPLRKMRKRKGIRRQDRDLFALALLANGKEPPGIGQVGPSFMFQNQNLEQMTQIPTGMEENS